VSVVLLLAGVAFAAGFIDAIAGGGGLLTLPALLLGLGPGSDRLALGTNKGQSVFGSFSALVTYARGKKIDRDRALPSFVAALLGSIAGVRLVLAIDPKRLRPVVLALLVFVALFFAVRGARGKREGAKREASHLKHPVLVALVIGLVLGCYDGFFGPGVGAFLIALYVAFFGDDLTRATANAKVANFASNLGSVVTYAIAGNIVWRLALPMAAAQMLGATLGARFAMKGGERVVRVALLLVVVALVVRLAIQTVHG
jgi:hypothetical protein